MKLRIHLLAIAIVILAGSTVHATVTFALTFQDVVNNTDQNWDDPNYGASAQSTLLSSLNEFGSVFTDSAVIALNITSSQSASYAARAVTATYELEPGGRFYDGNTYLKITTGADINGAAFDCSIDYSFNYAALGISDENGDGAVDVRDFTLNIDGLTRHEIIHILGMGSFITPGASQTDRFARHDMFLHDSAGNAFVTPAGSLSLTANLNDPNSYFDPIGTGPNYQIASQGDYSHLTGIMYPYRTTINADDMLYLSTLGYGLVPEPSSLLTLLSGLAILCGTGRARRNNSAV